MQYVSGRRINQDFGVPGITTNDTVVNVDGRIAVGIGTSATADIDTNQIRIRDNIIDSRGVIGSFGYFLTKDEEGLTWTNVPPLGNNSIFLAEDGDILNNIGLQTYTGLNFISDQLLGITTNPDNPGFADIRIDPRWFRDRTPGGGGGIYTTGTVGIGLTQPRLGPVGILTDVKLDVLGDAIFTGVVSATSFTGEFNVDTKDIKVSGIASFIGTTDNVIGDTNTGIVQIDGGVGIDKNVSIGASLFVNTNVGIGTSTNLDGNALTVNGGDVDILGDDTTVKIGTAVTISNGIVSATTFDGKFLDVEFLNVTGIATINSGIITDLSVTGFSTFTGTTDNVIGDTNTGIVQIDGGVGIDKNVSIGASLFVNNSLTVGTAVTISNGIVSATTGDFINLELDNLNVSGFSTFGDTARFDGAVNIFDDLFVSGNISVGGEGVTLDTETIRIEGKELLIGFTTAITPNNTTANSAGISIASTEGYSLVDLEIPGVNTTFNATITDRSATIATGAATTIGIATNSISLGQIVRGNFVSTGTTVTSIGSEVIGLSTETSNTVSGITALDFGTITSTPNTYKQFKWFKNGTFVGQGTDSFISNQPISIGGTQIGNGQLFAVGNNINFTEDQITAPTFVGGLTGIASTARDVIGGIGSLTSLSVSGISTLGTVKISAGIVTATSGIVTYFGEFNGPLTGTASTASFATTAFTLDGRVESEFNVAFAQTSGISTNVIGGIASVTSLSVSGISTLGTVEISAGIVTATSGIVTYFGEFNGPLTGTASTASFATTAFTLNNRVESEFNVAFAQTSGISTNVIGGIASVTSLSVSGISTLGLVKISAGIVTATSGIVTYFGEFNGPLTGTASTASFATTAFTLNNRVESEFNVAFATTAGIATNVIGGIASVTSLSVSGISTLGTVEISAGIVTATSGIVTYYGDGRYLENIISGVGIQSSGTIIGTGFTTLNFIGVGNTFVGVGKTINISINSSKFAGFAQTAGIATNLSGGAGGQVVYQSAADTTAFLSNGTAGQVLVSNGGTNAPQWANAASTGAIDGITIQDEGSIVGSGGSITALNFVGNGVVATASGSISTITISQSVNGSGGIANTATNVIGGIASVTSLSVSGISTLGTIQISSGIVTATSGIVTYFGEFNGPLTGTASTASFATTAFTLNNRVESDFNVAFAQTSGISTNVIGGIASVTSLSVSGISTLGTVKIDAGIITSTTGTAVTYFGNLTGTASTASFATTAFTLNNRVESDFNVAFAQTSGISTNVIGGIASVTQLSVSGVSTLGTVKIGAGIVTATSGIVTYYGDGQYLDNIITETEISNQSVAFAQTAGIATDLASGAEGSIPYQDGPSSTVFLSEPVETNQVLLYNNSSNAPEWNKVGLGTNTTGNYVKSVASGNLQQISVANTTGEGTDATISIANNPTLPGDVTVENDLTVNGSLLIVGVGATLIVDEFKVSDKNIIAGFTTDSGGNETSSDSTANAGGIAVASTVGNPLVDLTIAGIDTHPSTYKRLYWYQENAFAGLGTDAWLTNYALGVGTTKFPTGTYFAAGNVQITENDLSAVRNINASGVSTLGTVKIDAGIITSTTGTAVTYFGNLTGTASTASFATTSFSLNGVVASDLNVAFATTAGIATNVIGGIASVTSLKVNTTGISTLGTVKISAGIITSTTGTAVTYFGNLNRNCFYSIICYYILQS